MRLVCALLWLLAAQSALALEPHQIPEPLRPWLDWALEDSPQRRCPLVYDQALAHRCAWPSQLSLELGARAGGFNQRWLVDAETWLSLPGDRRHWPRNVTLNGAPVVVLERDGRPIVKAPPGEHEVQGYFAWNAIPDSLRLPEDTALVVVAGAGAPAATPPLIRDGRVWLRSGATSRDQADHLALRVFRKLADGVPVTLTTRLRLQVSGRPREELLGPVLPAGLVPLALDSPLPARLEPDGRLRVQLRTGDWTLEIAARAPGPVETLAPAPAPAPWPAQEVWVFAADNAVRRVTVAGVPALDPAQTELPGEWRALPAYLLESGASLDLVTRQRGDPDPAEPRLALHKSLWLDFDGGGYTFQDRLSGGPAPPRLEAAPGVELGRVSVNGQDQFVTRLPGAAAAGVAIRSRQIELLADGRIDPEAVTDLPAVGWQLTPTEVRATLQLPPGWRLLAVSGADSAGNVWLYRWTLLDLFIVLVTAAAFARLWGWPWGLLALAGLGLTWHEPDAPRLTWLVLLALAALCRVLPPGRLRTVTELGRRLALLGLLAIGLLFAVQQVRGALYPQLAEPPRTLYLDQGRVATEPPAVDDRALPAAPVPSGSLKLEAERRYISPPPAFSQYTPDIQVQTGPGLPDWGWTRVPLGWSGPVAPDQRLGLYLLPPWATRLLALLGVVLLGLLLGRAAAPDRRPGPGPAPQTVATAAAAALVVLLAQLPAPAGAAEFPPPELLEQLRERLTRPPDCAPRCASLGVLNLKAGPERLSLRLRLHAQSDTAVPLPVRADRFQPDTLSLDEQTVALFRGGDGLLWARLPAGIHTLSLAGPLPPDLASLEIPLPLTPGRVGTDLDGWTLEGVSGGVATGGQLKLVREQAETARLEAGLMPAFVEVSRELLLGVDWQVRTTVRRLSQADAAVLLRLPLLPGERVTSPGVRVEDGRALVNLPAARAETGWTSSLEPSERLTLEAPTSQPWVEAWRLRAGPLWHVDGSGPPPVARYDDSGQWAPLWRPWPGETLTLTVTRPPGVEGRTVTLDRALLTLRPGERFTAAGLELTLRASRGTEHTVTLPEGAEVTAVSLDGEDLPLRPGQTRIVLPLRPGIQQAVLAWRGPEGGGGLRYQAPAVAPGGELVNATVVIEPPRNRWVLLAGGPPLGPAVLFWGVLLVILAAAWALGRYGGAPLPAWQWFLLGVGLSQGTVWGALLVAGWLLLLAHRPALGARLGDWGFDLLQLALALLTMLALAALFDAIRAGLLGLPEMQVAGNGSHAYELRWYQDRAGDLLPQPWLVAAPLWLYRGLMLAWALWLALALLRWLAWGWGQYASGGLWRRPTLWRRRPAGPSAGPVKQEGA